MTDHKDLVRRAVSHLGVVASRRAPRWWHAKHLFGHGSTVSAEICAEAGFDPDAEIGPSEWERLESLYSALKPSTRLGPISAEELRGHPAGGIYFNVVGDRSVIVRIDRWEGDKPRGQGWVPFDGSWVPLPAPDILGEWFYLLAPAVSFSMTVEQMRTTGDQPSGRMKSVTRRANVPRWWPSKTVFNAWSGCFRQGRPDCLGTFEVVSAEMVGRWRCPDCQEDDIEPSCEIAGSGDPLAFYCHLCGRTMPGHDADTFTAEELALEGFPDMPADEFQAMLAKAGNVNEAGQACRIAFKEALIRFRDVAAEADGWEVGANAN